MIETKKALLVTEPRLEFGHGVLNKINRLRSSAELKLWASPLIQRASRDYAISVICPEEFPATNWAKARGLTTIPAEVSEKGKYLVARESIQLASKWHLFGELPRILQIAGISLGEALEAEIIPELRSLLEQIELARSLLEKTRPDIIYIESDLFPSGKAFQVVARAKGIKYTFLQPNSYRQLKKRLLEWWRYRTFTRSLLGGALYSFNKTSNNTSYTILVDTPYINFFTTVLPVMQELANRADCACYFIANELDVAYYKCGKRMKGIPGNDVEKIESRQIAKRIAAYYHAKLKRDIDFQRIFTYEGINFWEAIESAVDYLLSREPFDKIFSLLSFRKALDTLKPDILVLACGDKGTGVASHVLLAKKFAIPVLEIRHGVLSSNLLPRRQALDKIAIGGDYWKRIYIQLGARDDQVVVTGWPKYDIYNKLKDQAAKEQRSTINLLFAMGLNAKYNLEIIESIVLFIAGCAQLRLIVKPHPYDSAKTYEHMVKQYEQVILCESRADISRLVASSDLVIIISSTVGIEAALLDKPIICVNMASEQSQPVYVSNGVALEVKKLDNLIPAIKDALYNEEVRARLAEARKEFVYQHAYIQDGQASKRVADLSIQMIEKSRQAKSET